jgi:glutamine cyclotransferase
VVFEGTPVERINELECIDGLVWANLWQTNLIVVIEPVTGEVVARIDASNLAAEIRDGDGDTGVLNGIAFNPATAELLLTGKYWPTTFVVDLVPCSGSCVLPQLPTPLAE